MAKTPSKSSRDLPPAPQSGVEEEPVLFDAEGRDDWSIELARLDEYRRTGVSLDAEPILDAFVARVRQRAAERK